MAIQEYKKIHTLHNIWLNLANVFRPIPHTTHNKIFELLPLPSHTSNTLKGIYTNIIFQYNEYVTNTSFEVRQCLFPNILNLLQSQLLEKLRK